MGGARYFAHQLDGIVGELVFVCMGDYWMQNVSIQRGVYGCCEWFCDALVERH